MEELFNALVARIERLERTVDALAMSADVNVSRNETVTATKYTLADTQDALCETSTDVDERITTIEDALCELSKEE